MNLFINQVVKLEHIHHAHSHILIKCIASSSIKERTSTIHRLTTKLQQTTDLFFIGTVKDRRCHVKTTTFFVGYRHNTVIIEFSNLSLFAITHIIGVEYLSQFACRGTGLNHVVEHFTTAQRSKSQVRLKNLPNVHT